MPMNMIENITKVQQDKEDKKKNIICLSINFYLSITIVNL